VLLTQVEFNALIANSSKEILEDITWVEDEDHSPALEFRAEVRSDAGYPLFMRGSYNRIAETLSFALIHRGAGRIYALDLGKDHHNPNCKRVGEKHKHCYSEQLGDREAYVPEDITTPVTDPVNVWKQFCAEASIIHKGNMKQPPPIQRELFL
jgi:hypothetical protein